MQPVGRLMRVTFDVTGVQELLREVGRRIDALEAEAADVMDANGMGMMETAAELSPFDTGFMSSHVTYTPAPDRLSFTVGWHRADFDAEGFAPYYFFQEFGTEMHAAQPSLTPTAHQMLPDVPPDLAAAMRRVIIEGR